MTRFEERLSIKGWSSQEINEAKRIFSEAKKKKQPFFKRLELFTYWILFFIIILGGIIGAWLIEPFLIVLSTTGVLIVAGVFGLLYGGLISILVRDIERIEIHHHFLVFLFVIISSIGTSIFLGYNSHKIINQIPALAIHNPYVIGIVFSIGALLPYFLFTWIWYKEHGSL